jgi:hypothetical protein
MTGSGDPGMAGASTARALPDAAGSLPPGGAVHDSSALALQVGRGLCYLALLFASGDLWPSIRIGFTFRFSQLCVFLASIILLSGRRNRLRGFPGAAWLYAFIVWSLVTLPVSGYMERSVAYSVWTITDVMTIAVFVQYFDSEERVEALLRWFSISYIALSCFGAVQLVAGLLGHSLLTRQWWIHGVLPRINGLSYEPSYYSTYLIAGWVYAAYLKETAWDGPDRRIHRLCLWSTGAAILLSTSRMGWLMMALWWVFRASKRASRSLIRGAASKRALGRIAITTVAVTLSAGALLHYETDVIPSLDQASFLLTGLGVLRGGGESAEPRILAFERTWDAFLEHPLVGAGNGGLPAVIAAERGQGIFSLEDATANQGMSILLEILASTGIVGAAMVAGFALGVIYRTRQIRKRLSSTQRDITAALGWGLVWMLIMLQLNQNYLRIYLYMDLAVLLCCIVAFERTARSGRASAASVS